MEQLDVFRELNEVLQYYITDYNLQNGTNVRIGISYIDMYDSYKIRIYFTPEKPLTVFTFIPSEVPHLMASVYRLIKIIKKELNSKL